MTTKDWIKLVLIGCMLPFLINAPMLFIDSNAHEQVSNTAPACTPVFPKGTFESEVKHTQ